MRWIDEQINNPLGCIFGMFMGFVLLFVAIALIGFSATLLRNIIDWLTINVGPWSAILFAVIFILCIGYLMGKLAQKGLQ